jgi:hypothetical protein
MPFVWLVECKTCVLPFPVKSRVIVPGKSTDSLTPGDSAGSYECPHCHDIHAYLNADLIPGEGRLQSQ